MRFPPDRSRRLRRLVLVILENYWDIQKKLLHSVKMSPLMKSVMLLHFCAATLLAALPEKLLMWMQVSIQLLLIYSTVSKHGLISLLYFGPESRLFDSSSLNAGPISSDTLFPLIAGIKYCNS